MDTAAPTIVRISIGTALVTALVTSVATIAVIGKTSSFLAASSNFSAAASSTAPAPMTSDENLVVGAVKRTSPAVVSIIISADVPHIQNYYGRPPLGRQFSGGQNILIGGGSGFFASSDGYIITNKHVIDQPDAAYTVFTSDGKELEAHVAALDPILDIGVLKVSGANYPFLSFGDSTRLVVGQTVIAIGNALAQFQNTVSVGVISGLGRSIIAGDEFGGTETLDEVIQTDAAINPGNSGGPLLDLSGRVIGVNVAVAEGSQNIGFALPAAEVAPVIDSVRKTGKIIRPFLGVRYIPITPDIAQQRGLASDYGDLVTSGQGADEKAVIAGSPAAKAGIQPGDILLSADGIKLTPDKSLSAIIQSKRPGDTLALVVLSGHEQKTVSITLGTAPAQ